MLTISLIDRHVVFQYVKLVYVHPELRRKKIFVDTFPDIMDTPVFSVDEEHRRLISLSFEVHVTYHFMHGRIPEKGIRIIVPRIAQYDPFIRRIVPAFKKGIIEG